MYHYTTTPPPPGWTAYTHSSPPPAGGHYTYYAPQYTTPTASPVSRSSSKRHSTYARKTSFSQQEPAGWHSPPGYPSYEYGSPKAKHEPVSAFNGMKSKIRRFSLSGNGKGQSSSRPSSRPQKQPVYHDDVDHAYHDAPRVYREARYVPTATPTKAARGHKTRLSTDGHLYYSQVPDHFDDVKRSRGRSASTSQKTTPQKPKASPVKPARKATEADAVRAGIPAGYSIKNWDPTEAPIILLGSVFDSNSLGKWIYDWTVYHHGASSPMSDVAGDLWLLLIKLAGKVKRADEMLLRTRSRESREMLDDFLESGERLWLRFKKLLKACEHFMWRAAKREGGKSVSMGKNAGCEFVESIFGRDRELENTEKLMSSFRLWNMRYDANIEPLLRRPGA